MRKMLLATGLILVSLQQAHAIGCLSGAAAGAVVGAVGGCIAGHHLHKMQKQKKLEQKQQMQNQQQAPAGGAQPAPAQQYSSIFRTPRTFRGVFIYEVLF